MPSARYANAEGGIIITRDDESEFYIDSASSADLYDLVESGAYGTVAAYVPPPEPTAEELLAAERAGLNPYKLAFRLALSQLGWPGFDHMLDKVEQTVASARAADPFNAIVIWWDGVTQFIRRHPDVETFRTNAAFHPNGAAMSQQKVDALFRVAQAIDDGAGASAVADLVAAFEAEPWN